jgi:hypothetical protein
MHKDVTRATLVVAWGRCTRLCLWCRRNDRDGVQSAEGDSIKSAGASCLRSATNSSPRKSMSGWRHSARKVTPAAFDLLALKMPRALRKAFPDEIHRLGLADIPWPLAAPGPPGKHVASNRLRDICAPRCLELFPKSSRASDPIRPVLANEFKRATGKKLHRAFRSRRRPHRRAGGANWTFHADQAHACKLVCEGRIPMIGMLLHPSSPLAMLCGRQPQAAAYPFSDLDITRTAHRWIQQHGDAARWSRRCDAGATARC